MGVYKEFIDVIDILRRLLCDLRNHRKSLLYKDLAP